MFWGDLEGMGLFSPPLPHSSNIQKPRPIWVNWLFKELDNWIYYAEMQIDILFYILDWWDCSVLQDIWVF